MNLRAFGSLIIVKLQVSTYGSNRHLYISYSFIFALISFNLLLLCVFFILLPCINFVYLLPRHLTLNLHSTDPKLILTVLQWAWTLTRKACNLPCRRKLSRNWRLSRPIQLCFADSEWTYGPPASLRWANRTCKVLWDVTGKQHFSVCSEDDFFSSKCKKKSPGVLPKTQASVQSIAPSPQTSIKSRNSLLNQPGATLPR